MPVTVETQFPLDNMDIGHHICDSVRRLQLRASIVLLYILEICCVNCTRVEMCISGVFAADVAVGTQEQVV